MMGHSWHELIDLHHSSWWLQMTWWHIGTRPSVTTILNGLFYSSVMWIIIHNMVVILHHSCHVTDIKQTMFQRSQEVSNPSIYELIVDSSCQNDTYHSMDPYLITPWPCDTHLYISEQGHHQFGYWPVPSHCLRQCWFIIINSLAPGKFEWNFRYVIFQGI